MEQNSKLTPLEILNLDVLIKAAQERGLSFDDEVLHDLDQAEAHAELAEAMWEARHGAFVFNEDDQVIIQQIKDLASQLEVSPTLRQLIEMRDEAVRLLSSESN